MSAEHGFFGCTHLLDPISAAAHILDYKRDPNDLLGAHCVAIIGGMHTFVSMIMLMSALIKDSGHRKCTLGIYLVTFVPIAILCQYRFPVSGKPPESPFDMPLPIMYVNASLAVLGIANGVILGGTETPGKAKEA